MTIYVRSIEISSRPIFISNFQQNVRLREQERREKCKRAASLSLCAPVYIFVEHTGVEPVTSFPNAFGTSKRSSQMS